MSKPDWPAHLRSMQKQSGMLQAELIQLNDPSVSKASLQETLIAQSQHPSTVMQAAVLEALGTRVRTEPAQAAEGPSALPTL